eukprot:2315532-Pyramimonas_sp.AAC.1
MVEDLAREAALVVLELHPEKTKILHNVHCVGGRAQIPDFVRIAGMSIEILSVEGSTECSGRKLCFREPNRMEIESRISGAWGKFHALKQELIGKRYSLKDRIRLFNGAVTPHILHGSEA